MKKNNRANVVPFRQDSEFLFRLGMKYADKKNYDTALKYLLKVTEAEPYNADYQFNLAGVLAELKQIEKSNEILLGILKNIDPTLTECYFGIGCNYFDMENLKKAKEYFEKYVYFDPDGAFAEEVYDVLYYLQIYDDVGYDNKRNKLITRLVNEGKKLLGKGEYKKACEKLEKAIEIDPEIVGPRNDLSIACFLDGDTDKAISIASSVLKLDPGDIFAHCNLALYYKGSERMDLYTTELKKLSKLEIRDSEEVEKLVDTYLMLREYGEIPRIPSRYEGDPGEMTEVFQGVLKDKVLSEEALNALSKALKASSQGNSNKQPGRAASARNKSKPSTVLWHKEWEAVINCAIQKKEYNYEGSYKKELKTLWMNFIKKAYPEKLPVIKKVEVWAAVLEYMYCKDHLIHISKKKLADKYEVSESSIASKLKNFS